MLTITIEAGEFYDEETEEFYSVDHHVLELEHSLVSLSKWESKWEKPFLTDKQKTSEEVLGYIEAMCLDPKIPPEVFSRMSSEHLTQVLEYMDSKMTATWFSEVTNEPKSREIITAELIYYWMVAFQIPMECQYWHLNRLFTLIKICNMKNQKPKKMSRAEIAARNRELNEQRRAQLGTSG